ncbi:hypothetical protein KL86DPRO_60266 [uncultured delta proteobacterium]|uniref:Metallo-beta-lactamase domain-containing protein n=1 Tax=uncultured delta proteobacterium TaxID=34034 RepID=A0A212KGD7_9DELT|nr:hypothetical protein KL86DPRO_60266 [uncultured delta proteobacterium]
MLTAGDVFAMCANQEIIVGSMRIDVLVDEADHSGDVSLLNNATPELLAQYVPSKKLSLPYTSLLIRDKGRIFLIDSGMGNRLLENLQQKGIALEEINFILIAVRLRVKKKVQNLNAMWYKEFAKNFATQGDFGHESP